MHSGARKIRLAYVVSHPIQYQSTLLRLIAADPAIDLTVFFCSDFSVRSYHDQGFGVAVEWDVPLLEGYRSVVLPRWFETHSPGALRPVSRGFFRHFARGVNGEPFDAVWVHGYSSINAMHAMLAAKAHGLPVLTRSDSWLGDRSRSPAKLWIKRGFFRLLRALVDGVLAVGTKNLQYWRHYMGEEFPIFLMPYAVDNAYFENAAEAAAAQVDTLRQSLGIAASRPVILYASKLQERKHCDHLLQAYLELRRDASLDAALVIVGDGEMRASLEQAAANSGVDGIVFAGFRNQSELPTFFRMSSVFVLPARHEPWGLIVNEAMASGLPVVVSDDVGCAVDLVRNGENGFVYPLGDIPALTSALVTTLRPGASSRMGERSRGMIQAWSFAADLHALRSALAALTRLSLITG